MSEDSLVYRCVLVLIIRGCSRVPQLYVVGRCDARRRTVIEKERDETLLIFLL